MNNRLQLALLVLVFLSPPVLAYLLFYTNIWELPGSSGNHGDLVDPAQPVRDAVFTSTTGAPFKFSELRKRWVLLTVIESACDRDCENNLFKIQQVRLTQGKNVDRVSSVAVFTSPRSATELDHLNQLFPEVLFLQGQGYTGFHQQLMGLTAGEDSEKRIYVVDPLGNVMMSYDVDADPSGMRKDLGRLLKISQVG